MVNGRHTSGIGIPEDITRLVQPAAARDPIHTKVWSADTTVYGVALTIAYINATLDVPNCGATSNCDARAVFTISKTFQANPSGSAGRTPANP